MNQKTSLQKSLFPRFSLKAISLFTVIVFLCSDFLSFPAQALADPRPQTTDHSPNSYQSEQSGDWGSLDHRQLKENQSQDSLQAIRLQSPVSSLQPGFVIPSELGKIDEVYFPATDHRPQTIDYKEVS